MLCLLSFSFYCECCIIRMGGRIFEMFVLFIQNEQKTTNIKTSCVRVSNNKRETQKLCAMWFRLMDTFEDQNNTDIFRFLNVKHL